MSEHVVTFKAEHLRNEIGGDGHLTHRYRYVDTDGFAHTWTIPTSAVVSVEDVPWQVLEGDVYRTPDGVYEILGGRVLQAGVEEADSVESHSFQEDELIYRDPDLK